MLTMLELAAKSKYQEQVSKPICMLFGSLKAYQTHCGIWWQDIEPCYAPQIMISE